MGGSARIGMGTVTLAVAMLALALAGTAASQDPLPEGPSVLVHATSDNAELVKTIPVANGPGQSPRVVMSMGPGQLPDLIQGDRLRATAEVQITADCTFQRPRCAGSPYRYSPRLRGRLILAGGAQVTGGANAVAIGSPDDNTCRQKTGDREHHCMLVPRGGIDVGGGENLPCNLDSCHVNFVVEAWAGNPGAADVVVVGGQRPNGTILQDKGRINVVRVRGAADQQAEQHSTTARVHKALPPNLSKQVVYSQKLEGLRDREQLEVEVEMITNINHLPYATRTGARVILAKGRQAVGQGHEVKEIAEANGEISENNGFNCTQAESPCLTRKVGVLKMKKDASGPLYVNLVAIVGPKNRPARPGDHVKVSPGGVMRVTRFPSELFG